jgi:hypothetical protein
MFKDGLLKGRRILVTGGGTGLGKGWRKNSCSSAPSYSFAAGANRCAKQPPPN